MHFFIIIMAAVLPTKGRVNGKKQPCHLVRLAPGSKVLGGGVHLKWSWRSGFCAKQTRPAGFFRLGPAGRLAQ